MGAWIAWAIVAIGLAVGEIFTPGLFFLGPLAVAGVASAIVAAIGAGIAIQVIVFAVASLASLAVLRPLARAHLHMPPSLRTGTAALVGARAIVVQRVDENGGRIRLGGEEWSARAYVPEQVFEPGAHVEVAEIQGATALVYE
ncbi:MAG TPA: NfeD family protein [Gaiellaceae bacterium]|jgi:membrane protein implicated in regulation of membrane protease activity|nr:NfeD family protein [Gaiellaceae bacterium]